ncbi:hypothetical protein [Lacihabitans sp. CS3-21]|jgi:hypothetical protein|uniref:hypothetical protein n=1 Tax=Lacihabitans sp. CS3-21 TaxID=2487332 RepID=UPI0020CD319D|nr:hypothetical protein [Lacihabitans sp. CS3-21]MCP9746814.1 hypothetical protein [Lacihabitans sp. CS3-21]MDP1817908.1 hypothetical protein [Leadbetterella sp.]
MKAIDKLNDDILKITLKIQTEYPEISVYLTEMPVTIPNVSSPKINISSLSDYYESLKILLKDYIENQKLLSI